MGKEILQQKPDRQEGLFFWFNPKALPDGQAFANELRQRCVADDRTETRNDECAENRQRFDNSALAELAAVEQLTAVKEYESDDRQRRREAETESYRQNYPVTDPVEIDRRKH